MCNRPTITWALLWVSSDSGIQIVFNFRETLFANITLNCSLKYIFFSFNTCLIFSVQNCKTRNFLWHRGSYRCTYFVFVLCWEVYGEFKRFVLFKSGWKSFGNLVWLSGWWIKPLISIGVRGALNLRFPEDLIAWSWLSRLKILSVIQNYLGALIDGRRKLLTLAEWGWGFLNLFLLLCLSLIVILIVHPYWKKYQNKLECNMSFHKPHENWKHMNNLLAAIS